MQMNVLHAQAVCLFLSCAGNAAKIFAAFHQNFFILEDVNKGLSKCVLAGWESPLGEEPE
jgi:hypothetical protein